MVDHIVECKNVQFSYRKRAVLNDISFGVSAGINGILGPNGAGKTTLFSLLTTLREPASGSIKIMGHSMSSPDGRKVARAHLGYLPQKYNLMGFSSCSANVEYAAWANGVDARDCKAAAQRALETVDLGSHASSKARTLSGGMRQRLGIACAIAHQPKLLILDEPTVGLDPLQRVELRANLATIAATTCVILSTHIVDDIERIAQRVLVLRNGKFVFDESVSSLEALAPHVHPGLSALEAGYASLMQASTS
ncbi:ATP-binding cassette domain-containing protein [Micrococcales bacterium 31B]|nr:ATP-binding cassette domain-containing protein [Micrococcales bacterium 31B]